MKRNGIISLWKFIFSLVIILYHTTRFIPNKDHYLFRGGYIAVEFFFVVSGYFIAKQAFSSLKKNTVKETANILFNRLKKMLPYILVAYILQLVFILLGENDYKTHEILNTIFSPFLLFEFGIGNKIVLGQLWYLSVYLIGINVFYPLLKKYKGGFVYFISPLIVLFGLGYLANKCPLGLDIYYNKWNDYICLGFVRGFAELNIGFILFYINKVLEKVNYTKFFRVFLTLVGEGFLILVVLILNKESSHYYDYVSLLLISISVGIIMSGKTLEKNLLSNKVIFYLEKLSLLLFINHYFVKALVVYIQTKMVFFNNVIIVIYVLITLVFSIIEERLLPLFNKVPIKKLIIKD